MRTAVLLFLALVAALAADHRSLPRDAGRGHTSRYCYTCERTPSGRVRRSSGARRAFKEMHPCPATGRPAGPCPGYLIDHVKALKHGGTDTPDNMQWQTESEARAKDRIEWG